ncbi:hypothetical protein [Pseudofrankia sp. DC12]|uniref:hypothetical protein n=1 Tax=Pseudofrankia sp. DC12 TaxID=683315 RepID=UPI0005F878AF|nr:hypothetical protein [Pseudofrankia sp. DC12]
MLLELPDAPDEAFLAGFGDAAVVVIAPWGLRGPWAGAGRPNSELTIQAESGSLSLRGLPNRHNDEILGQELGLDENRLAELTRAAVIGTVPAGLA